MASCQSFFIAHAGSKEYQDVFSLCHVKSTLEKTNLKLDNPEFFEGDLLISKCVAGLAYVLIGKELDDVVTQRDTNGMPTGFDIENIDVDHLHNIAKKIVTDMCQSPREIALENDADPAEPFSWDTLYLHGSSMLRHGLLHSELRDAVRQGDPGRVWATFPYFCAVFRATNKHIYSREIIELLHRYHNIWTPDLRMAMLCHSVVNTTGKPGCWEGIDQYQEHGVRTHKVDFPLPDQRKPDNEYHRRLGSLLAMFRKLKARWWRR
jgi:hypothetical protein